MIEISPNLSESVAAGGQWTPSADARRSPRQRLRLYLRAGRIGEVALLMGAPFLGVLFAIPDGGALHLARGALVMGGIFALYLHVYLFNAWAGYPHDRVDPKKRDLVTVSGAVSMDRLLILSWASFAVAAMILFAMSAHLGAIALVVAGLWCAYAHPRFGLKQIAIVPTGLHLVHGVATNVLAQGAFSGNSWSGMREGALIGVYFGLVLAGGHLMHELVDRDADRDAGFRTSAIRFGVVSVFRASLLLFTASTAWFCFLAQRGLVPAAAPLSLLLIYPFHVVAVVAAARDGLGVEALLRLRDRYRVLYSLAGVGIVVTTLYSRFH